MCIRRSKRRNYKNNRGGREMSEFIISFELYTIIYIIILIPVLTFLIVLAYRTAKCVENWVLVKFNRRMVNENQKIIMENIKAGNELTKTQIKLRDELELTKKELAND